MADGAVKRKLHRMVLQSVEDECSLSKGIAIRPYSEEQHHEAIPNIYARSFGEPPWPSDWDRFEEFDPQGVFVAEDADSHTPVGYVISFRRPTYGYISVVAVLPECRRRGIGFAVVSTAVNYLHGLGVDVVKVDAPADSPPAVGLYKKAGFRVESTFED